MHLLSIAQAKVLSVFLVHHEKLSEIKVLILGDLLDVQLLYDPTARTILLLSQRHKTAACHKKCPFCCLPTCHLFTSFGPSSRANPLASVFNLPNSATLSVLGSPLWVSLHVGR